MVLMCSLNVFQKTTSESYTQGKEKKSEEKKERIQPPFSMFPSVVASEVSVVMDTLSVVIAADQNSVHRMSKPDSHSLTFTLT